MRYALTLLHFFFFFNDTATTEIYTLSLHDALPILPAELVAQRSQHALGELAVAARAKARVQRRRDQDRKSTRLNSSHSQISYAVFCLKKKNTDARSARSAPLVSTRHNTDNPLSRTC